MSLPVPHTGRRWPGRGRRRTGSPNGVSASSRIIPHRYADEGDKGQRFRRLVRRREALMVRREINEES